ncbi:THAP domain-containing protein 1 B-like [Anabrus simplex]|uniref:THAP domain-containing protein 1 B-like n=1 Tax=Anabrus simplex TaxID=316456 RepID=UPI0035A3AB37
MPTSCSAYNCMNRADKTRHISYYNFPLQDTELTKKWVANMKRKDWYPTKNSRLCSEHFETKFMYYTNDQRRLLRNAVPTVFSFSQYIRKKVIKRAPARKRRLEETESAEISDPAIQPGPSGDHIDHDHRYCLPSPDKMKLLYMIRSRKKILL